MPLPTRTHRRRRQELTPRRAALPREVTEGRLRPMRRTPRVGRRPHGQMRRVWGREERAEERARREVAAEEAQEGGMTRRVKVGWRKEAQEAKRKRRQEAAGRRKARELKLGLLSWTEECGVFEPWMEVSEG